MDNMKLVEEKQKGNKFFGGEMIRFLDLALGWLASLISVMEGRDYWPELWMRSFHFCRNGSKILQML